jgi:membrane-associated protease RseP (regulator of RpoE activity)
MQSDDSSAAMTNETALVHEANLTLPQKAIDEANELRRRARALMAEAGAMEIELEERKSKLQKGKVANLSAMMDSLFNSNRPLTPAAVARTLREEWWSVDQLVMVLERLYGQQQQHDVSVSPIKKSFHITSTSNAVSVTNQTESALVATYMQCILDAASILDQETEQTARGRWSGQGVATLQSRLRDWRRTDEEAFQRRLAVDMNAATNSNVSAQDYMRQTLGLQSKSEFNVSRVVERVIPVPLWVPSSLIRLIAASKALLEDKDIKAIKERILPASRFYCTNVDSIPSAAVFRGNIRSRVSPAGSFDKNLTASVFSEIQELMKREQLSLRVQLFLMDDPEWRPNRDSREAAPKPVILALPTAVIPNESQIEHSRTRTAVKIVASALAVLTTFSYSIGCYALNQKFFISIVDQHDITALLACLPVFIGVCAVAVLREVAHFLVARLRGITIGTPIPIPSTLLGTFGCITPLRSFPPNRAAMLDFALGGPMAAVVVSVLLMVLGITRTVNASSAALLHFPVVPMVLLRSSFFAGLLLTMLAPKVMMLPASQPIPIHPFFMIGFSGLVVSALNLLPVFRLDGGRACSAAMGPRFGAIASAWTLLFMLSVALSGSTGLAWSWGLVVVFLQRHPEIPLQDDTTEVNNLRLGMWIASLATSILTLCPFPGGTGLL